MSSYSFQYSFRGKDKTWTLRADSDSQQKSAANPVEYTNNVDENFNSGNDKWSVKQLMRLLRLYRAHPCLWDTRDPYNRSRKSRKAALIDITEAMGEDFTCSQISRKIQILRATYRHEKLCIKQRIRRGIGAKTKLKWFALAHSFLKNVYRLEKDKKEGVESDSALEDAVVLTIDPETDDEYLQSKDIDIKPEPEKDCESTSTNGYSINSPAPVIKDEANYSIEGENVFLENRKWTSHDSLQFIFLLRSYPLLWQLPSNETEVLEQRSIEYENALAEISRTMQLPKERLKKRLKAFRDICQLEVEKIKQYNNYKPNIVWWPMVQKYLETREQMVTTKINVFDHQSIFKRNEQTDRSDVDVALSPTIAKMYAPSPHTNDDSNTISDSLCADKESFTKPPTKLIMDGFEDNPLEGKWSLRHSVKFLRLYGAHRCLWDLKDPDYRSREMRNAALEDIAAAMGYGLDTDYVAKKIKIFRITYMQHRKRMIADIKENRKPDVKLRWFPLADCFLRPHIGLRSIKKQERELPQFDYQYVYTNLNLIDPDLLTDFTIDCS